MKDNYDLVQPIPVVSQNNQQIVFLLDANDTPAHQELIAHVKSGDYFGLLATKLDAISQEISSDPSGQTIALQQIVDDLLFLQHRCVIKQK